MHYTVLFLLGFCASLAAGRQPPLDIRNILGRDETNLARVLDQGSTQFDERFGHLHELLPSRVFPHVSALLLAVPRKLTSEDMWKQVRQHYFPWGDPQLDNISRPDASSLLGMQIQAAASIFRNEPIEAFSTFFDKAMQTTRKWTSLVDKIMLLTEEESVALAAAIARQAYERLDKVKAFIGDPTDETNLIEFVKAVLLSPTIRPETLEIYASMARERPEFRICSNIVHLVHANPLNYAISEGLGSLNDNSFMSVHLAIKKIAKNREELLIYDPKLHSIDNLRANLEIASRILGIDQRAIHVNAGIDHTFINQFCRRPELQQYASEFIFDRQAIEKDISYGIFSIDSTTKRKIFLEKYQYTLHRLWLAARPAKFGQVNPLSVFSALLDIYDSARVAGATSIVVLKNSRRSLIRTDMRRLSAEACRALDRLFRIGQPMEKNKLTREAISAFAQFYIECQGMPSPRKSFFELFLLEE